MIHVRKAVLRHGTRNEILAELIFTCNKFLEFNILTFMITLHSNNSESSQHAPIYNFVENTFEWLLSQSYPKVHHLAGIQK